MLVVFEKGNIVRSRVDEVRLTGRNTMGVQFAKPDAGDAIVAVARGAESLIDEDEDASSPSAPTEVAAAESAHPEPSAPEDGTATTADDAVPSGNATDPGAAGSSEPPESGEPPEPDQGGSQ